MSDDQLSFSSVDIKRMPGLGDAFSIEGLQPGLNVIYGPNGVGKTTLVRAMKRLLWHELEPQSARLQAQCMLNGNQWLLECDAGYSHVECDGTPGSLPLENGRVVSERYDLNLQDLLLANDRRFAEVIAREMAGGFDVSRAADEAGASSRPAGAGINERTAYRDAQKRVKKAQQQQNALEQRRRRLAALVDRREAARTAAERRDLLQEALDYRRAERAQMRARERLSEFPHHIKKLRDDDEAALQEVKEKLSDRKARKAQLDRDLSALNAVIEEINLPDGGVSGSDLEVLSSAQSKLPAIADNIEKLRSKLKNAEAEAEAARQVLGEYASEAHLKEVDAKVATEIAHFARRAEENRARREAMRKLDSFLQNESEEFVSSDDLRRARDLLLDWLHSTDLSRPPLWPPLVILCVSLLLTVGAIPVLFQTWVALLLVPPVLILWVVGGVLLLRRLRHQGTDSSDLQRRYGALGFEEVAKWETSAVLESVSRLEKRIAAAALDEERNQQRRMIAEELEGAEEKHRQLLQEKEEIAARLGLAPQESEELDEAVLYLLMENLNRWQAAAQEAAGLRSELETALELQQEKSSAASRILATYGYESTDAAEIVTGHIADLQKRQEAYRNTAQALKQTRKSMSEREEEIGELEAAYKAFFTQRLLEPGDEQHFYDSLRQVERFRDAVRDHHSSQDALNALDDVFGQHPDLAGKSEAELKDARDSAEQEAGELEAIITEITEIETEIKAARGAHTLEEALVEQEEREQDLRARRDRDCRALATHVLSEYLREENAERTLPPVFRRAKELFATVTDGRYRLALDGGNPPAFRAVDSINGGRSYALDELSGGTRLQLLLAVRLAFVSVQETHVKLPLFLDEALGNSDEARAQAIIEATLRLADDGRQVFYMTAQADEVDKWRAMAGDAIHVVDLGQLRNFDAAAEWPEVETPFVAPTVSKPAGLPREEYGKVLNVPPLDPRTASGESTHLWYVLEDMELLYHLLRANIETIGQVKNLVESGHDELLPHSQYEALVAYGKAIDESVDQWRVGRGKVVDRPVLKRSGAVSSAFIDEVSRLAENVKGDGKAVVAALAKGEVSGFRTSKRKELEQFLTDQGYIDEREILSSEEVHAHVLSLLQSEIEADVVQPQQLSALVEVILAFG